MHATDRVVDCIFTEHVWVAAVHLDLIDIVHKAFLLVLTDWTVMVSGTHSTAGDCEWLSWLLSYACAGLARSASAESQKLQQHRSEPRLSHWALTVPESKPYPTVYPFESFTLSGVNDCCDAKALRVVG